MEVVMLGVLGSCFNDSNVFYGVLVTLTVLGVFAAWVWERWNS